jgi:hypothetical protein
VRARLLLAAGACLALAVALAPPPPTAGRGVMGAVGASMGGARVMLVNALFLRAEAQKKAGLIEDAAALYESVLELDPPNEAATVYLVGVIVDELMPQVTDVDGRFRWWREARALLDRAIRRRPRSAVLHTRAATLILHAHLTDPAFEPLLVRELGLPRRVALGHLRTAVRERATLPRGRPHLVQIGVLVPMFAADMLRDGAFAVAAEALAAGEETLALRAEVLAEMRVHEDDQADLATRLRLGIDALRATAEVLRGGDGRAAARRAVDAYRALEPGDGVPGILDDLLAK